jgi:endonuclease/exonuclease/phosphatase family metal-dependent hydrolase
MQFKTPQFLALLCFLCALGVKSPVLAQLPNELRVLTYNIHHGEGVDGKIDLERLAAVIRSVEPHVVAVQEVDQGTARTARVDQPAELARLTGMKCIFARNIDWEGGGYGTAVLTTLRVKGVEQHRLKSHYDGEQRGVQVVELGAGDDTVVFFATHLNYRPEEGERLDSVKKIRALLAGYAGTPAILAGDLNAEPASETMRQFAVDWQVANAEPLSTYPAEAPAKQIDYVLVRVGSRWTVQDVRVLDEAVASDHRPLLAVLRGVPQ